MENQTGILFVGFEGETLSALTRLATDADWHAISVPSSGVVPDLPLYDKCGLALVACDPSKLEGVQYLVPTLQRIRPDMLVLCYLSCPDCGHDEWMLRAGAHDVVTAELSEQELFCALTRAQLEWKSNAGRSRSHFADALTDESDGIVGSSRALEDVLQQARSAASGVCSVLITGESGTGKDLIARYIHRHSARGRGDLVPVDCVSLPEKLLESELFGHEKGAFTDAKVAKPGLFECADGGTLFLDEVGEITPYLQAKLLRVLQERKLRRVGGTQLRSIDIRLIAATNLDIEEALREKRFREDLYYRICVVKIHIPPLRDRREDIPDLMDHFLAKYNRERSLGPLRFHHNAVEVMLRYDWPGNVRELENAVERVCSLCPTEVARVHDLPERLRPAFGDGASSGQVTVPYRTAKERVLQEFNRDYVASVLRASSGNVSEAARRSGLSRKKIYDMLKDSESGDRAA